MNLLFKARLTFMRVLTPFLKIPTNGFRIFGVLAIGLFLLILAANSLIQGYSQTREPTQSAVGILSFNGKLRIDGNVAWGTHGQSELPIIYNGTSIYLQNGTATLELLMGGSIELCEESNLTVQEIHSPYLFTLQHGSIIFDLPNSAGDIFFTPDFLIKIKPKLVDPEWLYPKKPKPIPRIKQIQSVKVIKESNVASSPEDLSFYFNIIGFIILCIGGLLLYNRLSNRDKDEVERQTRILNFNQYVQDNVSG